MLRLLGGLVCLVLAMAALVAALGLFDGPARRASFDLIAFFEQPTGGEGTIRALDLSVDRFAVATQGSREGEVGRMIERFTHEDGRRRVQDWTLRYLDGESARHGVVATRPDLNGPAIFMPRRGGYYYVWHQWLKPQTRSEEVTLRGWLDLRSDGALVNRAIVFRWSLPVAYVRVVFRPATG